MLSINRWRVGGWVYASLLFALLGLSQPEIARAATTVAKPEKAVLLLHGMNSNRKTWNKLVSSTSGFDGQCPNIREANFKTAKLKANSESIYCMRFDFGGLDRSLSAPKGLDNKTCSESGGCAGDYSTFAMLSREINSAIGAIKSRLGNNVQIVLLGHSRGGLAAREFLQGNSANKTNVVGLITTGTPHAGTALGRYYAYMGKNCLPESKYDGLFDFSTCGKDWRFVNSLLVSGVGGLDLRSPTIDFLSEASPAISALNVGIARLPKIQLTEISYDQIKFGCLGGDVIDSNKGCGYDIFGKILQNKPTTTGLNAVLNGRPREALAGDGIVPLKSQKMTQLQGWSRLVKSYAKSKRVHIAETEQILDLTTALTNMYRRLRWTN